MSKLIFSMDKVGEDTIAMSRKRGLSLGAANGRRHGDQWQSLMRKFSQANKEKCKAVPTDMPRVVRGKKTFPTESTYEGSWNVLGMSGDGTYCFPYPGVKYEGEFDDGVFHGNGELKYGNGVIVKGKWKKGQLTDRRIIFADGLEYCERNWSYCKVPDRRYTLEYDKGLKPGGDTYATNEQPPPAIPPGYYDVGDGFYEPITRTVYKYDDLTGIVRSPDLREQKWILENCRTNPVHPVGPAKNLYEKWLPPQLEAEVPPPPAGRPKAAIDELEIRSEDRRQSTLTGTACHWTTKYDDKDVDRKGLFWDPDAYRKSSMASVRSVKIGGRSLSGRISFRKSSSLAGSHEKEPNFSNVYPFLPGTRGSSDDKKKMFE